MFCGIFLKLWVSGVDSDVCLPPPSRKSVTPRGRAVRVGLGFMSAVDFQMPTPHFFLPRISAIVGVGGVLGIVWRVYILFSA